MNENADPKQFFEGDYLPLGKAIYENDAKHLNDLLDKKSVPVDSAKQFGDTDRPTLLMYAVILQKPDMVEVLLKHGANPDQSCLIRNRMKTVNVYTGEEILYHPINPLYWTICKIMNNSKSKKIAGLLINYGADINGFGDYYYSPLVNSLMYREGIELFDFLLDKRADINAYGDKMGTTPLETVTFGDWSLFILLLEKGSDPRILNFSGWNIMRRIERRLNSSSEKVKPFFENLKTRLVKEYGMTYPPVQDKERGKALRDSVYKVKGWNTQK
jgi:ankyrin repeat protein